jgi:hypothetical protein
MSSARFRWVQLSIQALKKKGSPEAVLRRLKQLPQKLEQLYAEIYSDIQELDPFDFDKVHQALSLLMFQNTVQTPLCACEILEAVFEEFSPAQMPDLGFRLVSFAANFIEFDEDSDEIRLAHLSVREFLESRAEYDGRRAHATISRACLFHVARYLDENATPSQRSWELGHFISYALTQWPYHVWKAESMRQEDDRLRDLLTSKNSTSVKPPAMAQWLDAVLKEIAKDGILEVGIVSMSPVHKFLIEAYGAPEDPGKMSRIDMATRLTRSDPPNPLFAYAQWGVREILENSLPIPAAAWEEINRDFRAPSLDFRIYCNLNLRRIAAYLIYLPPSVAAAFWQSTAPIFFAILHRSTQKEKRMMLDLFSHLRTRSFNVVESRASVLAFAIELASGTCKPQLLKMLIERGVHQDVPISTTELLHDLLLRDANYMEAKFEDQLECLRIILNAGADVDEAMFYAAAGCNLAAMQLILQRGANINAKDIDGRMPLRLSILDGDTEIVSFLLSNGADVRAKDDRGGGTPLHDAAYLDKEVPILERMIEYGADVNAVDNHGRTPLQYSIQGAATKLVSFLLSNGADVRTKDTSGWTPLHEAACRGVGVPILERMIECGADVNAEDIHGWTPLYSALQSLFDDRRSMSPEDNVRRKRRQLDLCKALVNHGADGIPTVYALFVGGDAPRPATINPVGTDRLTALFECVANLIFDERALAVRAICRDIENIRIVWLDELVNGALPYGWGQRRTEEGSRYFVDRNTRTATWKDPRRTAVSESEEMIRKRTIWNDPGLRLVFFESDHMESMTGRIVRRMAKYRQMDD